MPSPSAAVSLASAALEITGDAQVLAYAGPIWRMTLGLSNSEKSIS
jgi:hypothetical protein